MEWLVIVSAIIEILKYLDSKKTKKVTTAKVKAVAKIVGGKTQKAIDQANRKGLLPNILWIVNNLLKSGKDKKK